MVDSDDYDAIRLERFIKDERFGFGSVNGQSVFMKMMGMGYVLKAKGGDFVE